MKKLMLGFLALTLALWVVAGTQASAQSGNQQNQTDQNQASSKSGEMSGNVSSNGKTFTNDKDSKDYKVDNPDALKGHEGQHVAIIVHVDPDTGVIHIMHVEVPQQPLCCPPLSGSVSSGSELAHVGGPSPHQRQFL